MTTMTTDQGVSSLEAAVSSGLDMVKMFFKEAREADKIQMFQLAILYSIKHNKTETLKYLLENQEYDLYNSFNNSPRMSDYAFIGFYLSV